MAESKSARRKREAQNIIDKVLHGVPEGRVAPQVAENLRQHLVAHPGQPDRALLAHLKDQAAQAGQPMNVVLSDDDEPEPPPSIFGKYA